MASAGRPQVAWCAAAAAASGIQAGGGGGGPRGSEVAVAAVAEARGA